MTAWSVVATLVAVTAVGSTFLILGASEDGLATVPVPTTNASRVERLVQVAAAVSSEDLSLEVQRETTANSAIPDDAGETAEKSLGPPIGSITVLV